MNTDIRLSTDFFDHVKTKKLTRATGELGMLCVIRLWAWTARYKPNGEYDKMTGCDIEDAAGWKGEEGSFFEALCSIGFIDEQDNKYFAHGWIENNPWVCGSESRSDFARMCYLKKKHIESYEYLLSIGITGITKEEYEKIKIGGYSYVIGTHIGDYKGGYVGTIEDTVKVRSTPSPSPSPSPSPLPYTSQKESKEEKGQEIDTCPTHTENEDFNLSIIEPKKKEDACPYKKIVDIFHECAPENPQVKLLDDPLKRLIKARWKEDKQRQNLEWWNGFFLGCVATSDWLTGKVGNRSAYALSLILKADSFSKIINGTYVNRGKSQSAHVTASKKSPSEIMSEFHAQFAKSDKDAITVEATVIENNKLTG